MKLKIFSLIFIALVIPSISFAKCSEINEIYTGQSYWMMADNKANFCYKQYVTKGKLTVVTLKRIEGRADFDVKAYKQSNYRGLISSATASGAKTEVFTLPVLNHSNYVYFHIYNYSDKYGKYELYIDQINVEEIFGEAFAVTGIEYMAEAFLKSIFEIDENSNTSVKNNANKAAVVLVSNLQGKSLSDTTKTSIINELRREYVGNNFLASLLVNFGVALIERIYSRA